MKEQTEQLEPATPEPVTTDDSINEPTQSERHVAEREFYNAIYQGGNSSPFSWS